MSIPKRCMLLFAPLALLVSPGVSQDFGPPQVITAGADMASSVYAADLDGDGDADVLSSSKKDDTIAWYENLGTSGGSFLGFGPQQVITTGADWATCVFAADLDGDGDADVLSGSGLDDKIAWYENRLNGPTHDPWPAKVIANNVNAPRSVYATDLDGDGDADVLWASVKINYLVWCQNQGGGTFGPPQVISNDAVRARSVYATDLDGDGDADVLSASVTGDKIAWHENLGTSGGVFLGFGPHQVITTNANFAASVYATDLDGDGDADVISASYVDDKIAWYENRLNESTADFGVQQVITKSANGAWSVYAADLDGDGDADVLSASWDDDTIAWYKNRLNAPKQDFGPPQVITTNANGAASVYATDLDGDGDPDVLSASRWDNTIAWYENLMGPPTCNVVFCDTDPGNLGDVTLSTCNCSGGSITLSLYTPFANQFTYPLVGLGTTAASPTGVSELCLAGSTIGRYSKDAGAISGSGSFSVDLLNAASAPGGGVPTIGGSLCTGNTWRFQYWHRDGMNPSRFSKGIAGLIN